MVPSVVFRTLPTLTLAKAAFLPCFRLPPRQTKPNAEMKGFSSISVKTFPSVEECLAAEKDDDISIVFVDGSWHLMGDRNGRNDYEVGPRISGAKYFDIDDIASKGHSNPKGLPHMAPSMNLFAAAMDALGIKNEHHVIVYGTEGNMFTSRVWYTFRAMGHDPAKVHLMQGSIAEWSLKGGPLEQGPALAVRADELDLKKKPVYRSKDMSSFCAMHSVQKEIQDGANSHSVIVDARPAPRFTGQAPEPREGLRRGHMPGAINVPFIDLLEPHDYTKLRPADTLSEIFSSAGLDVSTEKKIILTCGSGVTACVVAAALESCGRDMKDTCVFDGSWVEWASEARNLVVNLS